MKKLTKLSLNELKESAECVLGKEEQVTIKGGYSMCFWGGGRVGYLTACYQNGTYLGTVCGNWACWEYNAIPNCQSNGYYGTTYATCA